MSFFAHPDVFEVPVVGVDDDRFGQHVTALVQPRPGHVIMPRGLDAARTRLARYKIPRSLWLVDHIKRSPAGKPDYRWALDVTLSTPLAEERRSNAGTIKTIDSFEAPEASKWARFH